ncbi:MAG: transferase [Anaerolineae bacterium]|jgi:acetyltransferase-like isoleucine patch superfamily enzyme
MGTFVHPTAVVHPNVELGEGVTVGEYAVVGVPPRGATPGELLTVVGAGSIIRSHTVIYAGNQIGERFQTGHATMIREFNRIGDDVSIGTHSVIEHHVEIGHAVRIHTGAFIPEYSVLEDEAWIGPHVVFTNALHPRCPRAKDCLRGPRIRRGAKIGANATVLPDLEVGEMALVGAASVVTHDVPARAVVAGNPARVVRSIDLLTCPYKLMATPYEDPA